MTIGQPKSPLTRKPGGDRGDWRVLLPARKLQRMAQSISEAGLDLRLGKHGIDRFAKAFENIDYGDQDVADTAVL